jgi:shikimate kinase/3-dehydroquinate synthase
MTESQSPSVASNKPISKTRTDDSGALPRPDRSIVLVGLMGAGKTTIGRRLAQKLGLGFVDADVEIERAAGESIPEIFERHGEAAFREGERRVIARLLEGERRVLATGGGAFMDESTRALIAEQGISIWLHAELDVLMRRVARRNNRPLLKQGDPRATMERLIAERYPVYATADIKVESIEGPHETVVDDVLALLDTYCRSAADNAPETGKRHRDTKMSDNSSIKTVRVDLAERSYDILVGPDLIANAGTHLKPLLRRARVAIVTDETVAGFHLAALTASLDAQAIRHDEIILPPGEATKCFSALQHLTEWLLETGIERGDLVIALGGGVIGDLTGFAAAITRRGVDFAQIPTTLLSQVDSSVGGKTGINTAQGKNLVGAFYQPRLVLADTGALETLPMRELLAGYAEVVKYGLINDRPFFDWLETNLDAIKAGDVATRTYAIVKSCEAKANIVAMDERESNVRALLNLGHTFGHALEAATGFSQKLVHGEGVAIGMALAFDLSARLGLCSGQDATRLRHHLERAGLPNKLADIEGPLPDADGLIALMGQDKKVVDGKLTFILARGIGEAFITHDVDPAVLRDMLSHRKTA